MTTEWEPTGRGGFRRTRIPQEVDGTVADETTKPMHGGDGVGQNLTAGQRTPLTREQSGGSNPPPRTLVRFNERLGLPGCEYLVRWRVETPWGSVRVHHWLAPDDDRFFHDHPWDFMTFVVKGGYTDKSPEGIQYLKAPTFQYRSATHQHTVYPDPGGAWTIVFTGPKIRNWGFWVAGKFKKANKYFLTYGHHPCDTEID